MFLQRNGKGTTVPLLWNEERNAFLLSNLEQRTERIPFFRKELGTERVPEIRGTTKALQKYYMTEIVPSIYEY